MLMIDRCAEKLVHIISTSILEKKIKKTLKESGVNGFTLFDVRGDGESGIQSGHMDGETNIMFMVVVSNSIYEQLLENLNVYTQKGHHLMVFTSNVDVMTPSKFDK
jgi:nitrogen regulatory protein PII